MTFYLDQTRLSILQTAVQNEERGGYFSLLSSWMLTRLLNKKAMTARGAMVKSVTKMLWRHPEIHHARRAGAEAK